MTERIEIRQYIPCVVWGKPTHRVFVAVHGDMSHKEDAAIAAFALAAEDRGWQTLSFDLPGHGARKDTESLNKVQNCVHDLQLVLEYARRRWAEVAFFGVSIGAYYGLIACQQAPPARALFLSPIVDMERMLADMMGWFGVTQQRLELEGEIETPIGKPLSWEYYQYVKQNPITAWAAPTAILHGERDETSLVQRVEAFCKAHGCELTVLDGEEHYLHKPEQLEKLRAWAMERLRE